VNVSLNVLERRHTEQSLSFPADSLGLMNGRARLMGQTLQRRGGRETSVVWPAQYDANLEINTITSAISDGE
jgi:hypothetical protein